MVASGGVQALGCMGASVVAHVSSVVAAPQAPEYKLSNCGAGR